MTSAREARDEGRRAALRMHHALGTDYDTPVDVTGVIEAAGIWLMFQPLDHLFGFYDRVGDAAGIAINSEHPARLQRFTAAHEYGHHVLGHRRSLDGESEVEGRVRDAPEEVAAQAFAATFLMPLPAVNRALSRLGLPRRLQRPRAEDIYELSLELDVSYAATVNQLAALSVITSGAAAELRRVRPADIKERLAGGNRPRNPWADVRRLRRAEPPEATGVYHVRQDDELDVRLAEIPSSGYRWWVQVAVDADGRDIDSRDTDDGVTARDRGATAPLELIDDAFRGRDGAGAATGAFGADGVRHLRFRAVTGGSGRIVAELRRPWERTGRAADGWEARVVVAPARGAEARRGLSANQQRLLVAA